MVAETCSLLLTSASAGHSAIGARSQACSVERIHSGLAGSAAQKKTAIEEAVEAPSDAAIHAVVTNRRWVCP
jgi:hypothetical protein